MAKQKKIGIFTYMLNNYGAVLQSFALQYYLRKDEAVCAEIVDFETIRHQQLNKIFKKYSENILIQICFVLLTLFRYKQLKERKNKTKLFKQKYIQFTRKYQIQDELLNNPPQEDIYISGSDQVFNPNGLNRDIYYLNFDKGCGRKVAYAPSFGISKFSQQTIDVIQKYINDFDALSCREEDGAELMSKLLNRKIPIVADPTLLLTKDEWSAVAVCPQYKRRYICIYDLNGAENLITIAKQIQKKTNLDIVCITDKVQKFYDVNKQIYNAGPAEFVGWIANADYVVTDSFHGTAFSLIFNRPFYTYIAVPASSSRIYNILSKLNLSDRIIEYGKSNDFVFENNTIYDYSHNLAKLISSSRNFIMNNVIECP